MRIPIYVNGVKIFKLNPSKACCLAARDWKGFGTGFNYMNGTLSNERERERERGFYD